MILSSSPTAISGCCIRLGDDGVYLHHADGHTAVGVTCVRIDGRGRVEILHDSPGPIVTMWASPDESLAARGITLGPSGGVGRTLITLATGGRALDLSDPADYARVAGPWCNAWIEWVHAPSCEQG